MGKQEMKKLKKIDLLMLRLTIGCRCDNLYAVSLDELKPCSFLHLWNGWRLEGRVDNDLSQAAWLILASKLKQTEAN